MGPSAPPVLLASAAPCCRVAAHVSVEDFAVETALGAGAYGAVDLVRSLGTGAYYALKRLPKKKKKKNKDIKKS